MQTANSLTPEEAAAQISECTIEESASYFILSLSMPGLEKKDIRIEREGGTLHISALRTIDGGRRREGRRMFESFLRLPAGSKPEAMTTSYRCGILSLLIPRDDSQSVH